MRPSAPIDLCGAPIHGVVPEGVPDGIARPLRATRFVDQGASVHAAGMEDVYACDEPRGEPGAIIAALDARSYTRPCFHSEHPRRARERESSRRGPGVLCLSPPHRRITMMGRRSDDTRARAAVKLPTRAWLRMSGCLDGTWHSRALSAGGGAHPGRRGAPQLRPLRRLFTLFAGCPGGHTQVLHPDPSRGLGMSEPK